MYDSLINIENETKEKWPDVLFIEFKSNEDCGYCEFITPSNLIVYNKCNDGSNIIKSESLKAIIEDVPQSIIFIKTNATFTSAIDEIAFYNPLLQSSKSVYLFSMFHPSVVEFLVK